jgi:hypothetical protein
MTVNSEEHRLLEGVVPESDFSTYHRYPELTELITSYSDPKLTRVLSAARHEPGTEWCILLEAEALRRGLTRERITLLMRDDIPGAYGDNVHDDTAAIQAAIDRAGKTYRWLPGWLPLPQWAQRRVNRARTVRFPPGRRFRLTAPMVLRPGVTISGGTGTRRSGDDQSGSSDDQ